MADEISITRKEAKIILDLIELVIERGYVLFVEEVALRKKLTKGVDNV